MAFWPLSSIFSIERDFMIMDYLNTVEEIGGFSNRRNNIFIICSYFFLLRIH